MDAILTPFRSAPNGFHLSYVGHIYHHLFITEAGGLRDGGAPVTDKAPMGGYGASLVGKAPEVGHGRSHTFLCPPVLGGCNEPTSGANIRSRVRPNPDIFGTKHVWFVRVESIPTNSTYDLQHICT
jgi:hypothetical protein